MNQCTHCCKNEVYAFNNMYGPNDFRITECMVYRMQNQTELCENLRHFRTVFHMHPHQLHGACHNVCMHSKILLIGTNKIPKNRTLGSERTRAFNVVHISILEGLKLIIK